MVGLLLLQVVLIGLNAVFACAEIAVLSVNENKMEKMAEKGNGSARNILSFLNRPESFLATIQVAITLSGFLGSAFAADNFAGTMAQWFLSLGLAIPKSVCVIVITLVLSYFTLVFGELVPKRLAMRKPQELSLKMAGLLKLVSVITKPLVWLLSVSTNGVLRLLGIDPNEASEQAGEEEIQLMVEAGDIEQGEKDLITQVFQFNDRTVRELCTHEKETVCLPAGTMDNWDTLIHESRHSLYPVFDDKRQEVLGILDVKDWFRAHPETLEEAMELVSAPLFLPESLKADDALAEMKRGRRKLAVVLDEYGGFEGVVTLQDLLSVIVGDLEGEEDIRQLDEKTWQILGNPALYDLEKATDMEIGADSNTLTGLVMEESGKVPEVKVYHFPDFDLDVEEVKNFQIERAKLVKS